MIYMRYEIYIEIQAQHPCVKCLDVPDMFSLLSSLKLYSNLENRFHHLYLINQEIVIDSLFNLKRMHLIKISIWLSCFSAIALFYMKKASGDLLVMVMILVGVAFIEVIIASFGF